MRTAVAVTVAAAAAACSAPARPPAVVGGHATAASSGPIGTGDPIVIEASDPDGRWVVACQARTDTDHDGVVGVHLGLHGDTYGDTMRPYLVLGSGTGLPIEAFVAQSPDGGWIAAIIGGKLVAIDAAGKHPPVTLADADLRDDDYPTLSPRYAAFAGRDRIVFMRHRDTGDVIVTHELSTGRDSEIAVPGAVWRVEPDAAGTWARVLTVRTDRDASGGLEWPSQQSSLSTRGCRGPISSYSTFGASGDEPDVLWVGLDGAGVVDDATVVTVAGTALVRVTRDHALTIGDQIALPAGCDPVVRATAPDPPRVLAGCGTTANGNVDLLLAGPGVDPLALGVEVTLADTVIRLAPGDRLACVDDALCIDVSSRALRKGTILYADGDRVLVRRDDDAYAVIDGDGHQILLGALDGYPTATAGPVLAIGATIVDLAAARITGTVDGEVAAVDRSGRALVTEAVADDTPGPDLAAGPARWVVPK